MKFPDALRRLRITFGARLEQVLGLILEMIEVRIGREWSCGHARTHFLGRLIVRMLAGGKLVRKKRIAMRWTSVLPADRIRPRAQL